MHSFMHSYLHFTLAINIIMIYSEYRSRETEIERKERNSNGTVHDSRRRNNVHTHIEI